MKSGQPAFELLCIDFTRCVAASQDYFRRLFITERVPQYRKSWQTTGSPRLLIIGQYRMGFELSQRNGASAMRVFIDYILPEATLERWLGLLFANFYARWCTHKMINDVVKHFTISSD